LCARAPLGPLDAQRLLEATDTATRLGALHAHLDDLAAMLRTRLDGR
jgi:Lon protease-like protein